MSIDYHTAQGDFGSIVHNLQPMVLSNFVMWLDLKVAEFKVYGQMILDGEQDMSNWFLHPSNSGGGGGSSQSIPRRKSDTFGNASIHSKHKRPVTFSTVSHPTKQMKTERITSHRKPNPVSIDLTDTEALSEMSQSDLTQTSNVETFNVLQLKQEPQTIDSSSPKASSSLSKSSFVERSISQNVKNEQLSYSEQSPHLPSSTFSPSSQTASEKSNVSSSLDSIQTVHRNQTLSEIRHVLPLKSEPEDTEFESISKEDISFDNSADQLLDNVTVTSVVPNIAGVGEQEPTDYHSQTIMKNDGTMFVVDSEQQSVERQHGIDMFGFSRVVRGIYRGIRGTMRGMRGAGRGIRGAGRGSSISEESLSQRKQRQQYHPKTLELALGNVRAGKMSQTKAAQIYGIPQQTISNRLNKEKDNVKRSQLGESYLPFLNVPDTE